MTNDEELEDRIRWRKTVAHNEAIFFWATTVLVSVALLGMMFLVCFAQPNI